MINEIPSSLGAFLYALIAFALFTVVPLIRHFVRKRSKAKEENNAE